MNPFPNSSKQSPPPFSLEEDKEQELAMVEESSIELYTTLSVRLHTSAVLHTFLCIPNYKSVLLLFFVSRWSRLNEYDVSASNNGWIAARDDGIYRYYRIKINKQTKCKRNKMRGEEAEPPPSPSSLSRSSSPWRGEHTAHMKTTFTYQGKGKGLSGWAPLDANACAMPSLSASPSSSFWIISIQRTDGSVLAVLDISRTGAIPMEHDNVRDTDPLLADVNKMNFDEFKRTVQEQQERDLPPPPRAVLKRIPEVMDDYIRNFLLRNGMHKTLDYFEVEWYERFGSGANHHTPMVPDNYLETTALLNRIEVLEHELRQHAELTTKATKQWAQAKKDRDFHRANHNRVVQEKTKITKDLKRAIDHASDLNPTLVELRERCEGLFKQKSLVVLERDRLQQQVQTLEKRLAELTEQRDVADKAAEEEAKGKKGAAKRKAAEPDGFAWPDDERPHLATTAAAGQHSDISLWSNQATFTAHSMTITKLALHPRKPAVASCSDDGSWRLSTVPHGEIIMSGEGHQNWVSSIAMHPSGTLVATGSGDKTIKLWDFASNSCRQTLQEHTDGVWSVDFQETGALIASGALDTTARIWDVELGKCRQALRGHVEAVNSVMWQPFTNILCSGSADKTVSLWDSRMNCCAQSFYGHTSAVMAVATLPSGEALASCDAEGVVMLWDIRRMEQRLTVACGPYPANHVTFDGSGQYLAVASDDTTIKIIDIKQETVAELTGHEDAVQCVAFDATANSFMVSCGSDRTIRYWS
eukprot:gene12546-8597_t